MPLTTGRRSVTASQAWHRTGPGGTCDHEDYPELDQLFAEAPGCAIRVSELVWVLPRGYRMTIGGRSVMAFGGAASIDFRYRAPDREWWGSELPTEADVQAVKPQCVV